MKTALFTIANSPVSLAVFHYLKRNTELKVVVLSRSFKTEKSNKTRSLSFKCFSALRFFISNLIPRKILYHLYKSRFKNKLEDTMLFNYRGFNDDSKLIELLEKEKVDVVLVSGFNFILSSTFLNKVKSIWNIHPSILPKYRGPDPLAWGVYEHQDTYGLTLHKMVKRMDAGPIINQVEVTPNIIWLPNIEILLAKQIPVLLQKPLFQWPKHNEISQNESLSTSRPSANLSSLCSKEYLIEN